jgi:DNA (cytosine-5)-methyltransferase 3A
MICYSAFDGSSCVQQAYKTLGITFDGIRNKYYASELDPYAQAVTKYNFPNTIFLGDVRNVDYNDLASKHDIDLMVAGSPCQDLSFAGKGLGFSAEGKRSNLFWIWLQQFKAIKPKYVLVENVRMKKQWQDMMSEGLGFEPQEINSKLQSAQNRVRLYWFGKRVGDKYVQVPIQDIKDLGIVLGDIVEDEVDSKYLAGDHLQKGYKGGNQLNPNYKSQANTIHDLNGKAGVVCAGTHGYANGYVQNGCIQVGETAEIKGYDIIKRVYSTKGKAPTLTTMQGGHREPKIATSDPKGGRIVNRRKLDGVRKDDDKSIPLKPYLEVREDDKTNCLSTVQKDNVIVQDLTWRKLTPLECERLQTLPDGYTQYGDFGGEQFDKDGNFIRYTTKPISNTQRYKMIGNGMTVSIIARILEGMEI